MRIILLSVLLAAPWTPLAQSVEDKPADPYFEQFNASKSPAPSGLMLKQGDRLAICGDSITEQKMYSRIMESYITACLPELEVTVRQYGWGGERGPGFLARMTNDCLRFKPTIATTCYGMNDHEYRAYEDRIGQTYRDSMTSIVKAFKGAGARVVLGSPGCVGPRVPWAKGTAEELNQNLAQLRNIDIEIAQREGVGFADVFWPMFVQEFMARQRHGTNFMVAGKDAVHPGWAGHTIMAYAFLKGLGVRGDIGTFTVDFRANQATVSQGHELVGFKDGVLEIRSKRYPFCSTAGDIAKDDNVQAGLALVPFHQELNRLMLVVQNPPAASCKVTWGTTSKTYTSTQLAQGINLASEFVANPFSEAFAKVDALVGAKQNYETRQIKDLFHGPEGRADAEATAALTERVHQTHAAALKDSVVPVTHTLRIEPL